MGCRSNHLGGGLALLVEVRGLKLIDSFIRFFFSLFHHSATAVRHWRPLVRFLSGL